MTEFTTPTTVGGIPVQRVLGSTDQVGTGTVYNYRVYVEDGIEINARKFAKRVDKILADPRGWTRGGKIAFRRVGEADPLPNTYCVLATPDTVNKLCYPLDTAGEVSCCQGWRVVINVERWMHAVPHWTKGRKTYRQMVINHEFGHRTGHSHRWCNGIGNPAPVMQQQTYGLQGCVENSWPLDYEL